MRQVHTCSVRIHITGTHCMSLVESSNYVLFSLPAVKFLWMRNSMK